MTTARATIRAYQPSDRAAVTGLVGAILVEYGFSLDMLGGLERDLAGASERSVTERAGLWVAALDGEVVGTVAIRPKDGESEQSSARSTPDERTCELKRLYLRIDRRGAGIGQALYAHAEAFAVAAGYERIWLNSSRRFAKARKLYERNGFVLLEEVQNEWEDNVYEKRLRAVG